MEKLTTTDVPLDYVHLFILRSIQTAFSDSSILVITFNKYVHHIDSTTVSCI